MSDALEKMRVFVASYPDADVLSGLSIDYADRVPDTAGLFPSGMVEARRRTDLMGNVTVEGQYNFALYAVLGKSPGDDEIATRNAQWLMGFQEWVQEMSATGRAPAFGDDPRRERVVAQNGEIYSADAEGTAVYAIRISVSYERHYRKGQ